MLRFHTPFDGKRYIGDNRLKLFHDSIYETALIAPGGCRIDHIPAEEIRIFEPDTAAGAAREGFVQCPCCLHIDNLRHG